MSQTETILLIVLGFSLATLIALFMGRGLWTAGVKVGARRMQRQVPSSLVGLQTERDRLRAEYAMLSQRLGSKLEAAKLQLAEQMAEVSRHRNRMQEIEALEANRGADNRRLSERVTELEFELADARAREDALRREVAYKEEAIARLRQTQEAPEPYQPARPAPATAHHQPPEDPEARLRQRIDRLTELAKGPAAPAEDFIIHAPPPPGPGPAEDPLLAETLAEAERRTADLTRDLEKLDAEWQQKLAGDPLPPIAEGESDANVVTLTNRIRDLRKSLGSANS